MNKEINMNNIDNEYFVSIIIPVYNGSNYMKEAIESAINQDYKNLEILVINDGSNDNGETRRIALQYKNKIKYFEKENGGVSSALNLGISKMKGDYFSWLSHDDIYHKSKISKQIEQLKKYDSNKIIFSTNSNFIDEKGEVLNNIFNKHRHENKKDPIDSFEYSLYKSFNGCSLLIPKEAFSESKFNTELKYVQDKEMWSVLALKGYSFYNIDEALVFNRIHDDQQTVKISGLRYSELKLMFDNLKDEIIYKDNLEYQILNKWGKINNIVESNKLELSVIIPKMKNNIKKILSKIRRKIIS